MPAASLTYSAWGTAVTTDFDNDGRPDVIMNGKYYLKLLRGTGGGRFTYMNTAWGIRDDCACSIDDGLAFGDVDGDGDLDVIGYRATFPTRLVDVYRNARRTLKATVVMAADDAEFAAHRREMFDELHGLCQQVALAKRDEIDHPSPERAVQIGFRHAAAVCDHLLLFGSFWQADDVPDRVIVDDLIDFQMRVFRDGTPAG